MESLAVTKSAEVQRSPGSLPLTSPSHLSQHSQPARVRMPNRSGAVSETVPETDADRSRSYIDCVPIPAGHHNAGFGTVTTGKATVRVSCAARFTVWESACPATVPVSVADSEPPVSLRTWV